MDKIILDKMRGSDKLKIQAAVVEILETKNFTLDRDLGISESIDPKGNWIMGFLNTSTTFEDIEGIRKSLGGNFKICITSKSKDKFLIRIEAPSEEFLRLGRNLRPLSQAQSSPSTAAQSSTFNNI